MTGTATLVLNELRKCCVSKCCVVSGFMTLIRSNTHRWFPNRCGRYFGNTVIRQNTKCSMVGTCVEARATRGLLHTREDWIQCVKYSRSEHGGYFFVSFCQCVSHPVITTWSLPTRGEKIWGCDIQQTDGEEKLTRDLSPRKYFTQTDWMIDFNFKYFLWKF